MGLHANESICSTKTKNRLASTTVDLLQSVRCLKALGTENVFTLGINREKAALIHQIYTRYTEEGDWLVTKKEELRNVSNTQFQKAGELMKSHNDRFHTEHTQSIISSKK